MTIDTAKLVQELDTLAGFSDAPSPAVTRIVFSEQDLRARVWLKGLYCDAGLEVREDAVGNTFARWTGAEPELPMVIDPPSVPACRPIESAQGARWTRGGSTGLADGRGA